MKKFTVRFEYYYHSLIIDLIIIEKEESIKFLESIKEMI